MTLEFGARGARGARLLLAAGMFAGVFGSVPALAQYPVKPIRVVVSVPPGGAPDIVMRIYADRLAPLLGQPMVVETRAGSAGNIATEVIAKSTPDGYSLLMAFDAMIAINPHLYPKWNLDPLKELVPIAPLAVAGSLLLVAHPSVPVKDFKGFLEYARAANPPLAFASGGSGSQHHMSMEMLKARAGINMLHVPYKGGAPAATAVMSGEVPVMVAGSVNTTQVRAGKLRILAVTGEKRLPIFPDTPSISETFPGYHVSTWMGLFGPTGVPTPVLERLRAEVRRVMSAPELRERLGTASSLDIYNASAEEFMATIRADYEKYGRVIKQFGIKAD